MRIFVTAGQGGTEFSRCQPQLCRECVWQRLRCPEGCKCFCHPIHRTVDRRLNGRHNQMLFALTPLPPLLRSDSAWRGFATWAMMGGLRYRGCLINRLVHLDCLLLFHDYIAPVSTLLFSSLKTLNWRNPCIVLTHKTD